MPAAALTYAWVTAAACSRAPSTAAGQFAVRRRAVLPTVVVSAMSPIGLPSREVVPSRNEHDRQPAMVHWALLGGAGVSGVEYCGNGFDLHELILVAEDGNAQQGAGNVVGAERVADDLPGGYEVLLAG